MWCLYYIYIEVKGNNKSESSFTTLFVCAWDKLAYNSTCSLELSKGKS